MTGIATNTHKPSKDEATGHDEAKVHQRLLEAGRWEGFLWEEPRHSQAVNLDGGFVEIRHNIARIAVFDAVGNSGGGDVEVLVDALEAAKVAFWPPGELFEAALRAGNWLCEPDLRPRLNNPLLCCAVADVNLYTGGVTAVVAGDCEVWCRQNNCWYPLIDTDMLEAEAREAFEQGRANGATAWQSQLATLDSPTAWRRTPLGLVVNPKVTVVSVEESDGIVVSTDGARLNPQRCEKLSDWLHVGIHDVPDNHTHKDPHGDLFVVQLADNR